MYVKSGEIDASLKLFYCSFLGSHEKLHSWESKRRRFSALCECVRVRKFSNFIQGKVWINVHVSFDESLKFEWLENFRFSTVSTRWHSALIDAPRGPHQLLQLPPRQKKDKLTKLRERHDEASMRCDNVMNEHRHKFSKWTKKKKRKTTNVSQTKEKI